MKNQIAQKLAALVEERTLLLKQMEQMRNDFETCRERVLELNGSIQATQEMFQMMGDNADDSESEAPSRADTNED